MSKFADTVTKIWHQVLDGFSHVKDLARVWVPKAVWVVQNLKTFSESEYGHAIAKAIGSDNGEEILNKISIASTKAILAFDVWNAAEAMPNATDEEKAQYILSKAKLSPKEQRDAFWHNVASLAIKIVSDGKITISEAIQLAEAYYQAEIASKKKP